MQEESALREPRTTLNREVELIGVVSVIEIRPCPRGQERLKEAAKLGFKIAIIPKANLPKSKIADLQMIAVERIDEAIAAINDMY